MGMKLAVLSYCTDDWRPDNYCYYSFKINEAYCKKWGIDWISHHSSNYELTPERHPSWFKIIAAIGVMSYTKYDYLWTIDADAAIVNQNFNVFELIEKYQEYDILASHDNDGLGFNWPNINCGSLIWKSTDWAKTFATKLWENPESLFNFDPEYDYRRAKYWEQSVINWWLRENQSQTHIKILDKTVINSDFPWWTPDAYNNVMHCMGSSNDIRLQYLKIKCEELGL